MFDGISFRVGWMNAGETGWETLDDAALIQEAARGEVDALATLYDRYASLLLAVAERTLGDRSAAEDLVHDVFVEVWRHAASYRPERGTVRTWVLVRLRSRALDRKRSAHSRREISGHPVPTRSSDTEADVAFATLPDRRAVRLALRELSDVQREVLELGYFEGLTLSEIAELTGTPLGTVKSRTAAALAKLRVAMHATEVTGG
jgi:RNA polymerase sigma-70 factor, ECF subfamily